MTEPNVLIKNALENYDNNNEKYYKFVQKIKNIKIDNEESIIYLYDSKDKLLLSSKFEILGMFSNNSWSWSWSIPSYDKNKTNIAKKLLNYGIELDTNYQYLKAGLITSNYDITNKIQLDIHLAIASYLSKQPFILKINFYKHYIGVHKEETINGFSTVIAGQDRFNYITVDNDIIEDEYTYFIIKDFDKIK